MKVQSINPATEELLAEFEAMSADMAIDLSRACAGAQQAWARQSVEERAVFAKNAAGILRKKSEEYARLMTLEMGKPITQSRAEVEKCAWLCEYYAQSAPGFLQPEAAATDAPKSFVRFDPLGVVLGIMPWNFPFWQVFRFAIPALLAGNGAVLKHASNVSQCGLAIEKIFREAGFPQGIFPTLLIDSGSVAALIEHPSIAAVSLTGSTQAGMSVAEKAGRHLKKCVLELGGSDPFIVLADADIARAAEVALQSRTINNGQSCIAAKRFIVEKSVAQAFTQKLIERFKTLKVGDPLDESVNIGPLAKPEIRLQLEQQVREAVAQGAKLLLGGQAIPVKGYFFEPALMAGVTPEMTLGREETFGPVMPLFVAENAEQALALANASVFGLGANLWTKNLDLAEKMAERIESGFVAINGMVKSDPRLPFGGVKQSGFGRELGSYGIREFVNIKTVVIH